MAKGLDSLPEDQFNYCFGTAKRKSELQELLGDQAYKAAFKEWERRKRAKNEAKPAPANIPAHEGHFFEEGEIEGGQ